MMNAKTLTISVFTVGLLVSTARGETALITTRVATGLSRPVFVAAPPGDTDRLFIVEQNTATIKIMNLATQVVNGTEFLVVTDVRSSGNEQGLLGLAFHPDYDSNGVFFVNYTAEDLGGDTVVARYTVSANPDIADAASKEVILTVGQFAGNHNGGWIGFGPNDGHLYVAMGDGGNACDPGEKAQDVNNLLGKILRIDVDGNDFPGDGDRDYAIPPDNPFVGTNGADEVYAYGVRNPWRCSHDRVTGDLYIGDVGQNRREEISLIPAGTSSQNFGWDCMEGTFCSDISPSNCTVNGCTCNDPDLTLPIHDYDRLSGGHCSVTGGYVYRGCAIPDLRGTYFFADYCSANIWSFRYDGSTPTVQDRTAELVPIAGQGTISWVSSFGEDGNGELYICDLFGGEVFKIIPDGAVDAPTPHDYDNDGNVNGLDLARFDNCLTGPTAAFTDCLCDVFNTDAGTGASTVDLRDFADFQGTFGN